jgi:hypothetical protein
MLLRFLLFLVCFFFAGSGGKFTELKAMTVGPGIYVLRSAHSKAGASRGLSDPWPRV